MNAAEHFAAAEKALERAEARDARPSELDRYLRIAEVHAKPRRRCAVRDRQAPLSHPERAAGGRILVRRLHGPAGTAGRQPPPRRTT